MVPQYGPLPLSRVLKYGPLGFMGHIRGIKDSPFKTHIKSHVKSKP